MQFLLFHLMLYFICTLALAMLTNVFHANKALWIELNWKREREGGWSITCQHAACTQTSRRSSGESASCESEECGCIATCLQQTCPVSCHTYITSHITFSLYPSFFTWIPLTVTDVAAVLLEPTFFCVFFNSSQSQDSVVYFQTDTFPVETQSDSHSDLKPGWIQNICPVCFLKLIPAALKGHYRKFQFLVRPLDGASGAAYQI